MKKPPRLIRYTLDRVLLALDPTQPLPPVPEPDDEHKRPPRRAREDRQ